MRTGVVEFGGTGRGILLLHGLMGRASTWWPVAQWLTEHGRVVGLDARGHGRSPHRTGPWRTEDFVEDAAEVLREFELAPAVVIGHSMGGLHAWMLAAKHPELVAGVVVEDMAPDQRGKSVEEWRWYFDAWPMPFQSLAQVRRFFGDAADYFIECFEERADGYWLISSLDELYRIAAEWGEREYWSQLAAVRCPILAIEAEHSAMPPGQIREIPARAGPGSRYLLAPGAGHVVHDSAPVVYREAVEKFLADLRD